jgi:hypothetical protein
MNIQHASLGAGRWNTLSFIEQMANVGSEIERTIAWRKKSNSDYAIKAFERALELLDLTIKDGKNKKRLRELVRTREALSDYFFFDNEYRTNDTIWHNYFFSFAYASRINR